MSTVIPRVEPQFVFPSELGGEKEALPESRQTFEVTAAQTSGLNQSFVKQVYSSASTRYLINRWSQPCQLQQVQDVI